MYTSDFYNLFINKKNNKIVIGMQILNPIVNTKKLPHTFDFLSDSYPNVLSTICFNDKNLPFSLEVKNTELGHLFEHLLLEKLCEKKLNSGRKSAAFTGRTDWNWERDPYGFFHIHINLKKSDNKYLKEAMIDTILIFNTLISYKKSMGRNIPPIEIRNL